MKVAHAYDHEAGFEFIGDYRSRVRCEKWQWVTVTKEVEQCGNPVILVHKLTGRSSAMRADCPSYRCPEHALPRATDALAHLSRCFRSVDQIWLGYIRRDDRTARVRVNGRGRRKKAERASVHRLDGTSWVFATHDLAGRKEPSEGEWVTSGVAIEHLAYTALRLPGVLKVTATDSWHHWYPEERKSTGEWWSLAKWPRKTYDLAVERACDWAGVEAWADVVERFTPEECRDLLKSMLVEISAERRM